METAAACEIARLPEELLSAAISRTAPRDACRAAAVSPAFRAAADPDAVWSTFLPRDLPPLAYGELSPAPLSKKELFLRLSDRPVLLPDRLMSMWLDRETGAKCYMLSARALLIVWSDTPQYWRWIPLTDSRFSEGAELMLVWWLEICGKIDSRMLTKNSTYAAYIVFKRADYSSGLDFPAHQVCLDFRRRNRHALAHNVLLPRKRHDGWLELELGEFYNEDGEDGEVCISLTGTKGGLQKRGLTVQGIEIRPKKSG